MYKTRSEAFCSRLAPEIFRSVEHNNDVWRSDPFDVREVHQEAREAFEELVEQVLMDDRAGRILLIRGEAGSGKTHLMRAFRNHVHRFNLALFSYMQMTTSAARYDRYILQKLIESLDQPYLTPEKSESSLLMLSKALVELLPAKDVEHFQGCDPDEAGKLVDGLLDRLVDQLRIPQLDLHLLRALIFLQSERQSIRLRVNKYLRMERLSDYDCDVLGNMPHRDPDDDALALVAQFAKLARGTFNRGLVICVDQFEDMFNLDVVEDRFARAMDSVRQLGEIPGTLVVVSCLDSFYERSRKWISAPVLSRLETDPAPVTIKAARSPKEAHQIISTRLNYLFDTAGVEVEETEAIDPIPPKAFEGFERATIRFLIDDCLRYRELAQARKQVPKKWPDEGPSIAAPPAVPNPTRLMQAWNDFRSQEQTVPEEEPALAAVLARAISSCGAELGAADSFSATIDPQKKSWVRVQQKNINGAARDLLVGVCERTTKFGLLSKQIKELADEAKKRGTIGVATRTTPFPTSPNAQASKALGQLIGAGGRRAVIQDSDWRNMVALDAFLKDRDPAEANEFLRTERPLTMLPFLREILALDDFVVGTAPKTEPKTEPLPKAGPVKLGVTVGRQAKDVAIEVEDLKRHMAFMGGTGSGKTTAALHIIENLLIRGIPAILVDRKGDLCGYRRPDTWKQPTGDADRDALREALLKKIEIAVYTPGKSAGRALAIPLVPRCGPEIHSDEREQLARISAGAIADMMGYTNNRSSQGRRAALQSALLQLSLEQQEIALDSLVAYIKEKDPSYMADLGSLTKFVDDLGVDLEILARQKRGLFGEGSERLDAATLFGLDDRRPPQARKTRLSIISTKSLGNKTDENFWVAQLLLEIHRWLSKHPSGKLQGVVLLDEADKYLPAVGQPATKQPIEDLLRRARSMGLSMFLASQNPGDFDYRCRDNIRTWMVGLLTQKRGIGKLEELFGAQGDTSMLAGQEPGQFHLLAEGQVTRMKSRRNALDLPSQISEEEIIELAAAGPRAAAEL